MNDCDRNPYSPPDADLNPDPAGFDYVGFWPRFGATVIDTVLILVITMPVGYWIYGGEYFLGDKFIYGTWDFLVTYVFPAVVVVAFWRYYSATPGKMAIRAVIVDARTGQRPSIGQLTGRYLAYYPSFLVFGLGLLWVAWDARKQGWHDKLAKTVVVRKNTTDSNGRAA